MGDGHEYFLWKTLSKSACITTAPRQRTGTADSTNNTGSFSSHIAGDSALGTCYVCSYLVVAGTRACLGIAGPEDVRGMDGITAGSSRG